MPELAVLVRDELARGAEALRQAGIAGGRREALVLWGGLAAMTPGDVVLRSDAPAEPALAAEFHRRVARRTAGEPLAYVTGTIGFRRLVLRCDRRALIPRPESEGVIDLALARAPAGRAIDLGTGSGCLALALADEGRYDEVVGVDRSGQALDLARENGRATALSVRWMEGDWIHPVRGERFAVLVTNPPYIATGELPGLDPAVREYEPLVALDGGSDGLDSARWILREAPAVLAPGGWLVMELDATRAEPTAGLAHAAGWRDVRVYDDLYKRPRYLTAHWE